MAQAVIFFSDKEQLVDRAASMRILATYGYTGNFIVHSPATRVTPGDALSEVLNTSCLTMTFSELGSLVEALEAQSISTSRAGMR